MGVEIERKFLVKNDSWRGTELSHAPVSQGYLAVGAGVTVRVRRKGECGYLTVKGPARGIDRPEYEYPIPLADAQAMLQDLVVTPLVEKVRYRVPWGEHVWDLDVFGGANRGLTMAEVELGSADEPFVVPDWAGEEVTGDPRYSNACLATHPFTAW